MSSYTVPELGELQKQILRHFFECKEKGPETASHISKSLNALQPSVARSIGLLVEQGYLYKDKERAAGKGKVINVRSLTLTDKGAMAAVVLGTNFEDLIKYFDRLKRKNSSAAEQVEYFQKFKEIFRDETKRDFIIARFAEYALQYDLFRDGVLKALSPNEMKMLLTYTSIKYNDAFGRAQTIKEIVKKYSLDKEFLKQRLVEERKRLDSMIDELD